MYIMAHRGASGFAPENTMAAFRKGLQSDADCLELDVRMTKDGVPVINHDPHIHRTSNGGRQYIHQLTFEELRTYDFGSWFSEEYQDEKIATLEEVLHLVKDASIDLNIELKNGPIIPETMERQVLDLVYTYGMESRTMYSSLDHQSMKRLYKMDPSAKIGLVLHVNLVNLMDYVKNCGINIYSIHPNFFYVTRQMIEEAHEEGLKVNIYTVDDPEWAREYEQLGVDGLITNSLLAYNSN